MTHAASETKLPTDLRKVLAADSKAKKKWDDLTPIARRDFISWIESAKQVETRKRRVDSIPSRLASGKRRPCCYSIVPLDLYTNLNGNPKAKAQWKTLSPDERRDLVSWIDSAKEKQEKGVRMAKVCVMLAAGKQRSLR